MTTLLLPREVGRTDATVTIVSSGTTAPPPMLELRGGAAAVPVAGAWTPLPTGAGAPDTWQQRISVAGLAPATTYRLVLTDGATTLAECRLRTLPEMLPDATAPLRMLLASCFSRERDPGGALGRAYLRLPASHQPDMALLTGDQVYLDTPIAHFLFKTHNPIQLAVEFATNYASTWGQRFPDGGFGALATDAASFLTADDHELWNNAPNVAAHLPDTWLPGGREMWARIATALFDAYQTPRRLTAIDIPPLSMRIVDTRLPRTADRSRFVDDATMAELAQWLTTLTGPGLLAIGQPLLAPPTGWTGNLTDWGLVDYAQYDELVRALAATSHDLLVVTGDVHFGRVAEIQLPSGRRIVELISSPMALVDDRAGRSWKLPPALFPARPVACAVSAPVSVGPFRTVENHFATLALWAEGSSVRVEHTAWEVGADGSLPRPLPGFSGRLN